jgi:hypothetical protein
VSIGRICYDLGVDAFPHNAKVLSPKVGHRRTLEDNEKEVISTKYRNHSDDDPYGDELTSLDADS